jgi:hypothetical protein
MAEKSQERKRKKSEYCSVANGADKNWREDIDKNWREDNWREDIAGGGARVVNVSEKAFN